MIKTITKKKKCKKAKWLSKEALQIVEKRREAKDKGEKERYTHLNAEFQRTARNKVWAQRNYFPTQVISKFVHIASPTWWSWLSYMVHSKEKSRSYPDFRQGDIDPTSERRVEESVAILIHHCDQAFHHKL